MRVELPVAATALVLPSIVGAKLPNQQSRSGALRNHNNKPLWKNPAILVQQQRVAADIDDSESNHAEPDIGILSSSQQSSSYLIRSLQTTNDIDDDATVNGTYGMDLCAMFDAKDQSATCDCNNWDSLVGSFSCALHGGDTYCVDNVQAQAVCGTGTIGVDSDGKTIGFTYCYSTTKPEVRSYCATFQISMDTFLTSGNIIGSGTNCSFAIDDQTCNACTIQKDCQSIDGQQLPGPGESALLCVERS